MAELCKAGVDVMCLEVYLEDGESVVWVMASEGNRAEGGGGLRGAWICHPGVM